MDLLSFVPLAIVLLTGIVTFGSLEALYRTRNGNANSLQYYRQLLYNVLFVVLLIACIAASPIGDSLKGQILALIGIVLSAGIALSSTNLLGNTLAGVMLKITRSFKTGDFISVTDYTGKVVARTLLNIEIQTFDRGLIFLPNLYLVTHPVKVFPESGVFVTVDITLGYDVDRIDVEEALLSAAKACEIDSAFVEVKALNDFSVHYVLNALISSLDAYVSTRSKLHGLVIDHLHQRSIEIVSPNFMNTRALGDGLVMPKPGKRRRKAAADSDEKVDDLLFEKANQADKLELLKASKERLDMLLEKDPDNVSRKLALEEKRAALEKKITALEREIQNL